MKDALKYSRIWNKKRSELKISDNVDQDWLEMQSQLNQHLPNTHGIQHGFKGLKYLKLWAVAAVSLVSAVVVYYSATKNNIKTNHQQHKTDSLLQARSDSNTYTQPSATNQQQTIIAADSAEGKQPPAIQITAAQKAAVLATNGNTFPTSINNNSSSAKNTSRTTAGNPINATNHPNTNHQTQNTLTGRLQAGAQPGNIYGKNNGASSNHQVLNTSGNSQMAAITNGNVTPSSSAEIITSSKAEEKNTASPGKPEGIIDSTHQTSPTRHLLNPADSATDKANARQHSPGAGNTQSNIADKAGKDKITTGKGGKNKTPKDKDKKVKKATNSGPSNIDWGILAGVNTSGSFIGKSKNANIYGNLPADIYLGLFTTFHLRDKWAIDVQVKVLNPQTISGSYTHANGSKVDSGKILQVTDSRKAYFITIPLHIAYWVNDRFSIKGGPVINIPVKQMSGTTTLAPETIKRDSTYYATTISQLNATRYNQQINFGVSGGVSLQFNRFNVEATYQKNLSGYSVTSGFGSYKSHSGSLQFTVGFKLNRPRP